jgi:cobalamin biosynthesis Mg chelatase CobN
LLEDELGVAQRPAERERQQREQAEAELLRAKSDAEREKLQREQVEADLQRAKRSAEVAHRRAEQHEQLRRMAEAAQNHAEAELYSAERGRQQLKQVTSKLHHAKRKSGFWSKSATGQEVTIGIILGLIFLCVMTVLIPWLLAH